MTFFKESQLEVHADHGIHEEVGYATQFLPQDFKTLLSAFSVIQEIKSDSGFIERTGHFGECHGEFRLHRWQVSYHPIVESVS